MRSVLSRALLLRKVFGREFAESWSSVRGLTPSHLYNVILSFDKKKMSFFVKIVILNLV